LDYGVEVNWFLLPGVFLLREDCDGTEEELPLERDTLRIGEASIEPGKKSVSSALSVADQ
jgi:hypothetical protein